MGLAALLITTLGVAAPAWGAKDETFLLSRQSPSAGGLTGDNFSGFPAISADGNHVAFYSTASNLSTEVNTDVTASEIFVRDLVTGAISLASRRTGTAPQQSASGVDFSSSISADGRYVAFASANDDLSTEDVNGVMDVFVRDLQASTTTLVSRETGAAGTGGGAPSGDPSISADGRYVAFRSDADNLSSADTNAVSNVFVRDLQANTTTLVSCTTCLVADAADAQSSQPSISADGRRVAFMSDANNLSTEDDNGWSNVFVRDLDTSTLTLVSRASGVAGTAGGLPSDEPAISGDGKHVAFTSFASLVPDDVNGVTKDVFLRDLQTDTTTLVSRPDTGGADCTSTVASPSTDARYVAFFSCASNLPGVVAPSPGHVFRRDLQTGTTTLISRQSAADGDLPGTDASSYPSISGDGRWVAFASDANNLSALDNNGFSNVFARDLVGPPPGPPVDPGTTQSGVPGPVPAPAPTPAAPPAQPAASAPPAVAFGAVATLPSSKACVSRRSFRIRLRKPAGATIARVVVRLNGKRAKTVTGKALTAPVDLRGLPKGRVKVDLVVTLADGRTVRGTRTYRTCAARR